MKKEHLYLLLFVAGAVIALQTVFIWLILSRFKKLTQKHKILEQDHDRISKGFDAQERLLEMWRNMTNVSEAGQAKRDDEILSLSELTGKGGF
jgi:hypothetical protein